MNTDNLNTDNFENFNDHGVQTFQGEGNHPMYELIWNFQENYFDPDFVEKIEMKFGLAKSYPNGLYWLFNTNTEVKAQTLRMMIENYVNNRKESKNE